MGLTAIRTMEVIEERIQLATDLAATTRKGEDLGLTDGDVAFYDALASCDGAWGPWETRNCK